MNADAFYQTMAGFCFTLLGLWWAVVQFRHEEWMADPVWRRLVSAVHLSFLAPGIMSLGAMIAGDLKIIWRLAFVLASVFSIVAMLNLLVVGRVPARGQRGSFITIGRWVIILLYVLVAVVAFDTSLVQIISKDIKPLQVEGSLLTLLVFLGVSIAWDFLAAPKGQV